MEGWRFNDVPHKKTRVGREKGCDGEGEERKGGEEDEAGEEDDCNLEELVRNSTIYRRGKGIRKSTVETGPDTVEVRPPPQNCTSRLPKPLVDVDDNDVACTNVVRQIIQSSRAGTLSSVIPIYTKETKEWRKPVFQEMDEGTASFLTSVWAGGVERELGLDQEPGRDYPLRDGDREACVTATDGDAYSDAELERPESPGYQVSSSFINCEIGVPKPRFRASTHEVLFKENGVTNVSGLTELSRGAKKVERMLLKRYRSLSNTHETYKKTVAMLGKVSSHQRFQ